MLHRFLNSNTTANNKYNYEFGEILCPHVTCLSKVVKLLCLGSFGFTDIMHKNEMLNPVFQSQMQITL